MVKMEEPTMYNIKGGGEWYDASYHGLSSTQGL